MTPDTPVRFENALTFKASRGPFFRLLLVNTLLTIVTLGIYRFWAKTRVRRYLWHNIRFLDDPLEYTGTGGELFFGFLIVLAVLFPFGLIYNAISVLVPPAQTELRVVLEVAYYTVLFALLQIGFYRMWRYRMSRTVWRGVRCGLDGSSWTFLCLAAGWSLLTLLTLGVVYPWMKIDLWRYQVQHTWLGDEAFDFNGDARTLLWPWLAVIGPPLIFALSLLTMQITGLTENVFNPTAYAGDRNTILGGLGIVALIVIAILPFSYLFYRICQSRLQISGLRIGAARFHSALPFGRLLGFAALAILTIVALAAPLGFVLFDSGSALIGTESSTAAPAMKSLMLKGAIASIVFSIVLAPMIWMIVYVFEAIKQTVESTSIENPQALEGASQRVSNAPRTGEGLADALDIGGF